MILPNFAERWVPDAKMLDHCLGDPTEKTRSRKRFLAAFGFAAADWQALQEALRQHPSTAEIALAREDQWGATYRAVGPLRCPDGRAPVLATFWIARADDPRPQLTTAIPR